MTRQIITPLGWEFLNKPSREWPTQDVEACTEYQSCRAGKPGLLCGKCLRIDNEAEPIKVRLQRVQR